MKKPLLKVAATLVSISIFFMGYSLGYWQSNANSNNRNYEYFQNANINRERGLVEEAIYDYYKSISELAIIDFRSIELLGDIYYCLSEYGAAQINYELLVSEIKNSGLIISEISRVDDKLEALKNSDYTNEIFESDISCYHSQN